MRNLALIVLLVICIVLVVVLNAQYLQEIIKRANQQQISVDDKPLLTKQSHNRLKASSVKPQQPSLSSAQAQQKPPVIITTKNGQNPQKDTLKERPDDSTTTNHRVAGLNCEKYGGPSEEIANEMVYWKDIPSDATYESPYANYGPNPKYLTFEPDQGGWNSKCCGECCLEICRPSQLTSLFTLLYRHSNVHGNGSGIGPCHGTHFGTTASTIVLFIVSWKIQKRQSIYLQRLFSF